MIIVVGLTSGLLTESAKRTEGVGADIMVQPPSASIFMAFSGAPMPIAIGDKLEQLEYVQAVAPVLVQFNSVNGLDIVYGIRPGELSRRVRGICFSLRARTSGPERHSGRRRLRESKEDQASARRCTSWSTIFMWRESSSMARARGCSF